jgi:hypothetical protein
MTHQSTHLPAYDLLGAAEGVALYENKNAMPRAFFVSQVIDASSHEESINILQAGDFKPGTTAVIENAGPGFSQLLRRAGQLGSANDLSSSGAARIAEDKRNYVVIETDNQKPEALVLSDNYYPGWRAFVDGSPVTIFRANCTMRAVAVPAGHHLVSFVFAPRTFYVSLYLSLAGAALTLIVLMFSAFKQKRSNRHDIRQDNQDY